MIVDYRGEVRPGDPDLERRTRQMQFTRARRRLFVLFKRGEAPRLLSEHYPECLE